MLEDESVTVGPPEETSNFPLSRCLTFLGRWEATVCTTRESGAADGLMEVNHKLW